MFPEIPEDRSGLSAAELRGHIRELRAFIRERVSTVYTSADERREARADIERAKALAAEIAAELADVEANAADADEFSEEGDPVEPDEGDEGEGEDDAGEASDAGTSTVIVETNSGASTSGTPAQVNTGLSVVPTGNTVEVPQRPRPDLVLARDGVDGYDAGEPFRSWGDVGAALTDRWGRISPTTNEKFHVAQIPSAYPPERQLSSDAIHNLRILQNLEFGLGLPGREDTEETAALCAPLTPYYGMACENTLRRPVAASLPGFQAPRGGVSIMPSPSLSDVSNAGIWTHEDDDDDEATKPCDEIVCGTPEDFVMYAVYWCLTIKNWHLLTFPELVEAFLNRGLALRARVAERQLLEGMAAGVPQMTVQPTAYSSSTQILTQILTYLAFLREQQRWDTEPMVGWAHRWLLAALQVDQARRRRTDGAFVVPSEAAINAQFASVGVDMTWTLDVPSWMTGPPNLSTLANPSAGLLGSLNQFGSEAEILIAPRGKFAMIDRAQLSIGVTGNNYYRDTAMIERNQVRFFVENYEGIVDTTSCPAHILNFTGLCHTGVQIDDLAIDCDLSAAA